jgi:hypothetical protein
MPRYWSKKVIEHSNALDLEPGVFTWDDPERIARSLLKSAKESQSKKAKSDLMSAMSMLNFYINRAGKKLPAGRRKVLEQAKKELRELGEK